MKSNNTVFRELMKKHGLTRPFAAKIIGVSLNTIDRWMVPATHGGLPNPSHRRMTNARLDHFRLSLERHLASEEGGETVDRRFKRTGTDSA